MVVNHPFCYEEECKNVRTSTNSFLVLSITIGESVPGSSKRALDFRKIEFLGERDSSPK
jgi:hypothetical protein